jgi:hypothetical protein
VAERASTGAGIGGTNEGEDILGGLTGVGCFAEAAWGAGPFLFAETGPGGGAGLVMMRRVGIAFLLSMTC